MGKKIFLALALSVLFLVPASAQTPTRDIYVTDCPCGPPGGSIQKITRAGVVTTIASRIELCPLGCKGRIVGCQAIIGVPSILLK